MKHAYSLQARLAWRLAAVFLLASTLAIGGILWRATTTVDSLEDRSLQAQARDIARYVEGGPEGGFELALPPRLRAAYRRWGRAFLYVVYDEDGAVLATSRPDAPALLQRQLPTGDEPAFFHLDGMELSPYYGYLLPAGPYRIAVLQGRLHGDVLMDSLFQEFLEVNAWWVLVLVLLALLVGVLTIRWSLAPVTAAAANAAAIGPDATGQRLPDQGLPAEVRPLVGAVNGALDRLERGFEMQRRFVADAAHELRTPFAVLTARIDSLEDSPAARALRSDVARTNRLLAQLLDVTRLDAAPLDTSGCVDLRTLALAVVHDLGPRAVRERRHLALVGAPGPVPVQGDGPAIERALSNVVENALNHSPPDGEVEIAVLAEGAVRVSDAGPGVAAEDGQAIFRRFWRGRSAPGGGAGLGLAIVAQTMKAHEGSVEVGQSCAGGAAFTLRFRPLGSPTISPTLPAPERPQVAHGPARVASQA